MAPWQTPNTNEFEYRKEVHIYDVCENIGTAYSKETLANNQYGKGSLPQIFIPNWETNKENIPIKFSESEKLSNYILPAEQAYDMEAKNIQHMLKRDLFYFYKLQDMAKKNDYKNLYDICSKEINSTTKALQRSMQKIGNEKSQTYDNAINYLYQKSNMKDCKLNNRMEKK